MLTRENADILLQEEHRCHWKQEKKGNKTGKFTLGPSIYLTYLIS